MGELCAIIVLNGGWVGQLYVEPFWPGRGIGRRMLDAAKREPPGGLRLWTFASNRRSQRFYERHGFVEVGDHLPGDERAAHSVGAHRDVVGDRDGAESHARSARFAVRWLRLHGIVSIQLVATPTSGRARSSSENPTPFSIARAGAVDPVGQ